MNDKPPIDYATDPIFQQFQYYMRLAFEEGYRDGNRGGTYWRDDWRNSIARKFLVENGLISGDEGYK